MSARKHQVSPTINPVTSDGLRRNQLALEALIVAAGASGVTSFNTRSGVVVLLTADVITALGFTLAGNAGKVVKVNAGATALELGIDLTGGGGGAYTYLTTAVGYTEAVTSGEKFVDVTASGQTIVLPTAVGNTAKLSYKLMVAGSLIIDGNAAETIDGGATATLTMAGEAITLISTNAAWRIF